MFSTIISAAALLASLFAIIFSVLARSYARDCYEYVRQVSKNAPQFTEMAELSSELTMQKDALAQISKGLRTIRNRMNVRETNEKRKLAQDSPAESDDEAWLRKTNARLQAGATIGDFGDE